MSYYVEYKIEVGLNTFFEGRLHKIWISENEKVQPVGFGWPNRKLAETLCLLQY